MHRRVKRAPVLTSFTCLIVVAGFCALAPAGQPFQLDASGDLLIGPLAFRPPAIDTEEPAPSQPADAAPPDEAPAASQDDAAPPDDEAVPPAEPEPEPQPRPELSPEMAELRDRVRRTVVYYYGQSLNTQSNTPGDVVQACLAFGCDTEIRTGSGTAKKVSGIGALSWNYPCAGYRLLTADAGRFIPRVGYGLQPRPGQLLAMLAMAQVGDDYELRVGEQSGTVADLVRSEQRSCRSGIDQSFVLIGLAHYLPEGATWENDFGRPWSIERLLVEELQREPDHAAAESVYRLTGLSFAINRVIGQGRPLEGQFARAARHIRDFQKHALDVQNTDGTWHPGFFAYRGTSSDTLGVLRSTGHILEWLAMSLDEDRLQDPQIVNAVTQVNNLLAGRSSKKYVYALSPRDIETLMHAVRALVIYDQRVFRPCDPIETEPQENEVAVSGR